MKLLIMGICLAVFILGVWSNANAQGITVRVSVASDGTQGKESPPFISDSNPYISADGRFVAFSSYAYNLVSGDTNGYEDVFIHDLLTGLTTLVSLTSEGAQANGYSTNSAISGDGRYVAFQSLARNLAPDNTYGVWNIFVHDRETGQTTRVSNTPEGAQANGHSYSPAISGDGRYVAFQSKASNLVTGDTNTWADIFVHDRQTGQTIRASVASDGAQANYQNVDNRPSISADGRYVAFASYAGNLVPGNTSTWADIFVHDRQTGQTTLVSNTPEGVQANGHSYDYAISGDGRYVAFASWACNLVPGDTSTWYDVFIHDRQTGQTTLVSNTPEGAQANGHSYYSPAISGDGRYVAFTSGANNFVPGDTSTWYDVFIHDRQTGQTTRVSMASDGAQANNHAGQPSISADGRYVAFASYASNLVPGDTNEQRDIFVHLPGFLVNSTGDEPDADPNDGLCDVNLTPEGSQCTLRAALEEANRQSGKDTIIFEIPMTDPGYSAATGTFTIRILSPLPDITEPVIINSTTQPGGRVAINGAMAGQTTDGLHFLAGDSIVRGLDIKGFGGNGLSFEIGSPSETDFENNPHLYTLKISNMEISGNCGWGIKSGGSMNIGFEGLSAKLTKINDNGKGTNCSAGGIFIYGPLGMNAVNFEITNNNGTGILSEKDLLLSGSQMHPIKINYNRGYGIQADAGNVHITGLASHQIIGNKGKGIYAGSFEAVSSYPYAGNIIIEAGITISDNASWGVQGMGVSIGIIGGIAGANSPVSIINNGNGDESWVGKIQGKMAILEKELYNWQGGGIFSHGGIEGGVTGGVEAAGIEIRDNGGPGILSEGDVYLMGSGYYPVKINYNRGYGIQADAGNVHLTGLAAHQIIGNKGKGIYAGGHIPVRGDLYGYAGNIIIESGIEISDNASWGVHGMGVSIGFVGDIAGTNRPVYINNNGKGDESWFGNIQENHTIIEKELYNWHGGGIFSYGGIEGGLIGGVKAAAVEIRSNGGDGIQSEGDVTLIGSLAYPVRIMSNIGAGIRTERNLTLSKGSVCYNSKGNIVADGNKDLQDISSCEEVNNIVDINNAAVSTDTTNVSLTLTCINPSGCEEMMFSNDGLIWSPPEPYAGTKEWTLSSGDGTKMVFMKFRDNAGNWSIPYGDTIGLNIYPSQYASAVKDFSSQYSTSSWSAARATGAPDTSTYGDDSSAWAPDPMNGTHEYIILEFERPVYADGVMIRETYGNGFVYQVDVLDVNDTLQTVWTGTDPSLPGSPADFEISFPRTDYLVKGVKIYVDTDHDLDAWEEIDAVQLRNSQDHLKDFMIAAKTGTGEGRVVDLAAGIDCGESCFGLYDEGTVINLTSLADEGSSFEGWQGACTGTGPCTVTISGNTTVIGTFQAIQAPPTCFMGDVGGNGAVGLEDAVLALKAASGYIQTVELFICADVNGDGKIGLEEALFALQVAAGAR